MIVNCVAYQNGRRLTNIPVSEIHSYISHKDCFVWVALNDPTPDELQTMQNEFDLHDLAVEDAQHGHQRPKIEEYDGSLFVVLQMIERAGDELTVGEVGIFVGANYVLSVRSGAKRGFTDVRVRCEREPELLKPRFRIRALRAHGRRRRPLFSHSRRTRNRNRKYRRAHVCQPDRARQYRSALRFETKADDPQTRHRAVVGGEQQTLRRPGAQLCVGLQDYFRDIYDHLLRLNQSVDSLRDMITTAISVAISLITIQENEVTKRLAGYAALVAVPTLIAGIYGMNFDHMPELNSPLWLSSHCAGNGRHRWLSVLALSQSEVALAI